MKTSIFTESLDLSEAQIDSENHLLKGVVLIRAGMSLNRRYYSEDVLKQAYPLFEGVKSYDSHKRGERQVSEISGWYANVRYQEGAIRADRYFSRTRSGQDVWTIAEDIVSKRAPRTLAGLSINAVGTGKSKKFDDGEALNVESITAATSIDDVSQPAAGGTYLTASNGDEMTEAILKSLTFEEWFESRPEYITRVKNEMKTVRQDDALTAAKAVAETAQQALQEAQTSNTALSEQIAKLQGELDLERRKLALEKAFRAAGLPKASEDDLRQRFEEAIPSDWIGIIQGEKAKLKSLGLGNRIQVTGAGQQVAAPIQETFKPDPEKEARRMIANAQSPEELKRVLESLGR